MSQASDLVASGDLPAEWQAGIDEVSAVCQKGFADLEGLDPDSEDVELLTNKLEDHGLHAYRYEPCDDGSVVVVYANDVSGNIKLKAFDDMVEASHWTPRAERQ